jgi:hypothetical protein
MSIIGHQNVSDEHEFDAGAVVRVDAFYDCDVISDLDEISSRLLQGCFPEDAVMSAAPTFKYWQCNKYLSWTPGSLTYQWDGDTVAVTNSNIYCIKTLGTNPAPPEAPVTGRHGSS